MIHCLLSLLLAFDFSAADKIIDQSIADHAQPGVVMAVGKDNTIVYEKAYGNRSLEPTTQPMELDTVFDMASCTKCIATATSVMILVEQGKIDVHAPVTRYLPEFGQNGKDKITVENLLLHTSGFPGDNPESDYKDGPAKAWERIYALPLKYKTGEGYIYSDLNFETLGKIVEVVSGQPLNLFARDNIFVPLGMNDTGYLPDDAHKGRCASTEYRKDHWMVEEVHDPRAYDLGGVAGHAGLFSTADDVAKWCQMFTGGKSVLKPETIKMMTTPHDLPKGNGGDDPNKDNGQRAYGFDVSSPYSGNRGDRFPKGASFGHTGYTGTSFWIDPGDKCYLVLLANRVHPHDTKEDSRGNIKMRHAVATEVAKILLDGTR